MKNLLLSIFVFFTGLFYSQCTHTIQLTDTYGDGWNGGAVSVSVNGATVFSNITFNSGFGPASGSFSAVAGQTIRVWRTYAGSFPSEMRIRVINSSGTVIINTIQPTTGTATSGGAAGLASCVTTTPPPNDLICNATSITCGQTIAGTTINATNSGTGEMISCGVSQSQPGVWYMIPGNGQIMTATLCGTAWDSKISVFSGTCTSLSCVGGNDDYGPACSSSSASYQWNSTSGTNYYILVHGYSSSSSFNISLNCYSPPPPAPTSAYANSNVICNGTSTTIAVNGVSGTVYWYTGSCGGSFIGTGSSMSVSPTTTTTYYARNYSGSQFSTGCASTTITVNPIPTVSVSSATNTICSGSNTQLISSVSDNGGSPITYSWAPSTGLTNPSAPSPFASPATTQTYYLYVTSNGCTNSASIPITVSPSVGFVSTVSGNNTIIAGTQETYSITPVASVTYQWAYTESVTSPLWINISNSNSPSISFTWPQTTTNGSVKVTVTNSSNCGTQVRFFNITTNGALPIELLYFEGEKVEFNNYLKWATASEYNTSHFVIEKSEDGYVWKKIGEVMSMGNSNQEIYYDLIDDNVSPVYNYYKLQQYDNDGVWETFGPILIDNRRVTKQVSMYTNLMGQMVLPDTPGVVIIVYKDGTIKRIFN